MVTASTGARGGGLAVRISRMSTSCEYDELRMFSYELSTLSDELDERVVHGCLLAGAAV